MKFDTILEYQRIDQELLNLESEFAKSKERAAFVTAKAKLEAATDTVNKLSQEASDLLANYNKLNARAEELKMRLDEFDRFIGGVADVNEADYYLRQIASISDEIAALEKTPRAITSVSTALMRSTRKLANSASKRPKTIKPLVRNTTRT